VTLNDLFGYLGAPLSHHRWSWGAVRPEDGAVFLRVWQDEQCRIDGAWFTQVTYCDFSNDNASNLLGYVERLKHIELVRNGAPSYMMMCQVQDVRASTREVAGFDHNDICVGGRLIEVEGIYWLRRLSSRPVPVVRRASAADAKLTTASRRRLLRAFEGHVSCGYGLE
jgi:hypothetical protein